MPVQSFDSQLRSSRVVGALSFRVSQLGVELSECEAGLAAQAELLRALVERVQALEARLRG